MSGEAPNLTEVVPHLEYVGGGWFRDSRVPKGEPAHMVHGPELLRWVQANLTR